MKHYSEFNNMEEVPKAFTKKQLKVIERLQKVFDACEREGLVVFTDGSLNISNNKHVQGDIEEIYYNLEENKIMKFDNGKVFIGVVNP